MAQESQLAHRVLSNTALPYITNVSPSNTDPHYVKGSSDILTSINGYAERRPGFSDTVETTPTVFNNLQRLFTWDRFDGTFYTMACDINAAGFAQVYKLQVGIDASFVSIYTDTSPTPFDFVVSNNTLYFSNGNVALKWDPINGVSKWGIVAPTTNTSLSAFCGTATTVGAIPWVNPTNFQGAPGASFTTVSLSAPVNTGATSGPLDASNYGFSIPSNNTISGLQVALTGFQNNQNARCTLGVQLLYSGGPIGQGKSVTLPSSVSTVNLGSATDNWGATLTPSIVNDLSFGLFITAFIQGRGPVISCTYSLSGGQITVFQSGGPIVTVSGAAGTFSAVNGGYTYEICYGNANTGHISSPSQPSNVTGNFSNVLNVSIPITASTDPQVTNIRVFRTTDGGGGTYFEIPGSPFPNITTTVTDNAPDASLNALSIAPTITFNDPPPPFQGMVYFSGRIWGFTGNKVWFSGLEEIIQGVPEESFPSGIAGNFWSFDQPVQGLEVCGAIDAQVLAIYCGGRVYAITGNTLDTFRRFIVSKRRGCRNRVAISALGSMAAWFDSAGQVWATDGSNLEELSIPIRPDTANLNQQLNCMTFHTQGRYHWLVLSTGTQLFIYDIDQDQWMPPWNFACQYIYSGETSPGNYVLMAATPTKAVQLNPNKFNDQGTSYSPVIKTNLLSTVPDFGSRFSYIATGIYNEPTRTGYPNTIQITNNGQRIKDVGICNDDDPTQAQYQTISPNLQDPKTVYNRAINGQFMKQHVYPLLAPASRWISIQITMEAFDRAENIYEIFMAYSKLGGR